MLRANISRLGTAALLALGLMTDASGAATVRWTRAADALTLDPHAQNDGVTHALLNHIYESLVWRDAKGALIPRVATEWKIKDGSPAIWVFSCARD